MSTAVESLRGAAVTPLGLEQIAAEELAAAGLRIRGVLVDQGVVEWEGDLPTLAAAHSAVHVVERLTVTADAFHARGFAELRRKVARVEWEQWLARGRSIALRVTSRGSRLYHENAIAERVRQGIEDRLGGPIELAPGAALDDERASSVQLVVVRLERDRCVIRVDASGPRLHRRGYRLATAKAPLRETLAAGLLRVSGWDRRSPLVDPFCGSGTIVIEAARWARGTPPGEARGFAFEHWPVWQACAPAPPRPTERVASSTPAILGSDRAEGAIEAARSNLERGGVADLVELRRSEFSSLELPGEGPGWIVTNPPYGHRTGGDSPRLFAAFGDWLRDRAPGWQVWTLCPDPASAAAAGLEWTEGPIVRNGGLQVRILGAHVG